MQQPQCFQIDPDGWVTPARHCPSENYNERPEGVEPELLVIHNISLPPGEFGGGYIEPFFQNRLDCDLHPYFREIADLRVSSHLLIDRYGELYQFVSLNKRAWHAGASEYAGRKECNDFSIGIELEGTDDIPYTEAQYKSLASMTRAIFRQFPLMNQHKMAGHCDIAPGRKTDPGASFDWVYFKTILKRG